MKKTVGFAEPWEGANRRSFGFFGKNFVSQFFACGREGKQ
jgi:hypothetical protein